MHANRKGFAGFVPGPLLLVLQGRDVYAHLQVHVQHVSQLQQRQDGKQASLNSRKETRSSIPRHARSARRQGPQEQRWWKGPGRRCPPSPGAAKAEPEGGQADEDGLFGRVNLYIETLTGTTGGLDDDAAGIGARSSRWRRSSGRHRGFCTETAWSKGLSRPRRGLLKTCCERGRLKKRRLEAYWSKGRSGPRKPRNGKAESVFRVGDIFGGEASR
ncbi:hypothetical protein LY76DRAFT_601808 [Colletotrichum caudatum]|nr:hypothetical protein LY76DRAFT_601808 [Colletotrichum caudatum]